MGWGCPSESGELCLTLRRFPALLWGKRLVRLGAARPLCSRKEVGSCTLPPATCSLMCFLPECLEALGGPRLGPSQPRTGLENVLQPMLHSPSSREPSDIWGPGLAPPLLPHPLASAPPDLSFQSIRTSCPAQHTWHYIESTLLKIGSYRICLL